MPVFSRTLIVLAALFVTLAARGGNGQSSSRHFLGLWEGVDVNDGSKRSVSITDRDNDGIFETASHDTYWTLCAGDRGIELAAGAARTDGVLETDGLVTCFDSAQTVPVRQTYEFSRRDGTLLATPHGTSLMPVMLHRISD